MDVSDDRIGRLEARIEELEARLRESPSPEGGPRATGTTEADRAALELGERPAPDRRSMLRALGLAGAAVAAGTASAAASASPAAAAHNDPLLIGTSNVEDQAHTTVLKYTAATPPAAGNVVTVADTNSGLGSNFPASLAGYAFGRVSNGVYGYTNVAGGNGVVGLTENSGAAGFGVYGKASGIDASAIVGEATASTGSQGIGVKGTSFGEAGVGVSGSCTSVNGPTTGVRGVSGSPLGVGVAGYADASIGATRGVQGIASSDIGRGVEGTAHTGFAVGAVSNRTHLLLQGAAGAPLGTSLARVAGEVVFDVNQDLWLCVAAGTPGTWRRISGPSTAGAFVPLPAPVRVYDSRPGFNPATGPKAKLTPSTPRAVDCTLNSSGVPAGASGVLVNLVATGTSQFGDMAIYRDGIPYPGTSNVNFSGNTVAVTTFSALSPAGKVAVRSNVAPDVVIDVLGYYQ